MPHACKSHTTYWIGHDFFLLYLVMVTVRVSYEYGYTCGSGRVEIFGTGRVRVTIIAMGTMG